MKRGTKLYYQGASHTLLEYTYLGMEDGKYVLLDNEARKVKYNLQFFNRLCMSKIMILSEIEEVLRRKIDGIHEQMRKHKVKFNPLDTVSTVYVNTKKNVGHIQTIHQYDRLTGRFIATFRSAKQAAKEVGNGENSTHIGNACKGTRKTCYGFRWSYNKYEFLPEDKTLKKDVPILEYDLNGNLIKVHKNISTACREIGSHIQNLNKAMKSKSSKHKGRIWKRQITK